MNERDYYGKQFKDRTKSGPSWLQGYRQKGIDHFQDVGFPTVRDEEWKYTNVAPLSKYTFDLSPNGLNRVEKKDAQHYFFGKLACTQLVFVNGRFSKSLSHFRKYPTGVLIQDLSSAMEENNPELRAYLDRAVDFKARPFAALNSAFLSDGAFIFLPKGKAISDPIHLLFLSTFSETPFASFPRNVIIAQEGSQATIVETYGNVGKGVYFTNNVTDLELWPNSSIHHYKIQREGDEAYHIGNIQARQEKDSELVSYSISLGGKLVRNDIGSTLNAKGISCTLNGLYMVSGHQHVDHHTMVDHAKPHCTSRELYKGILDGDSRGVFNGKILVRPDAQKTDATQTNRNLLLSERALVDTKPQLEIYADDVKCAHGATIGQLDEDAIFYLQSRGIGRETAGAILTYSFGRDLIDKIEIPEIRASLDCLLASRFSTHHVEAT